MLKITFIEKALIQSLILVVLLLCSFTVHATSQTRYLESGGEVIVHFDSDFSPADMEKLLLWLKNTTSTISTFYGEFPVNQVHVYVKAHPDAGEPVPWGEVWKEGPFRVDFQVDTKYPLQSFINDWTATHEFSHLFHPYTGNGHAWFGEGLASYLQNILRAREGTWTEQQAWDKLFDGLRRGEKKARQTGLSLFAASRNMRATQSYVQVYWGGAAFFLNTDIKLRKRTFGKQSLDSALRAFKRCCLLQKRNWTAKELLEKLDLLTGTTVFMDEYNLLLKQKSFPDFRANLDSIGIRLKDDKIILGPADSETGRLRQSIVTAGEIDQE